MTRASGGSGQAAAISAIVGTACYPHRMRWKAFAAVVTAGIAGAALAGAGLARGWWRMNHPDLSRFPVWGVDVSHHQGGDRLAIRRARAAGSFRLPQGDRRRRLHRSELPGELGRGERRGPARRRLSLLHFLPAGARSGRALPSRPATGSRRCPRRSTSSSAATAGRSPRTVRWRKIWPSGSRRSWTSPGASRHLRHPRGLRPLPPPVEIPTPYLDPRRLEGAPPSPGRPLGALAVRRPRSRSRHKHVRGP